MTINGIEKVTIPLSKHECGSPGCIELTAESVNHKTVTKTCMTIAKLDMLEIPKENRLMDPKKCNSNYQVQVTNHETNQFEMVTVNLKCSQSPDFVSPDGKL